jgi:hypothetical protein
MKVFENRMLRTIFGPKRVEIMGEWRKLRNEELHNSYSSPEKIIMMKSRKMIWAGHIARTEEKSNAYSYRIRTRKLEGKKPQGKPTRMWEDNIKMDL